MRGLDIGAELCAGAPLCIGVLPRGEDDTALPAGGTRTADAAGGACMAVPRGKLARSIC